MSEKLLSHQLRGALRDMTALMADRSRSEAVIKQTHQSVGAKLEMEFNEGRSKLDSDYQYATNAQEKAFKAEHNRIEAEFKTEYAQTEQEFKDSKKKILEKSAVNEKATASALQETIWLTETVFEATESQPIEQFVQTRKGIDGKIEALETIQDQARAAIQRYRQRPLPDPDFQITGQFATLEEAQVELEAQITKAQALLDRLTGLFIAGLLRGFWPLALLALIMLLGVGASAWLHRWRIENSMQSGALAGAIAAVFALVLIYIVGRSQVVRLHRPLHEAIAAGKFAAGEAMKLAEQQREDQRAGLVLRRDQDLVAAKEKYEPVLAEIKSRRDHHLERISEKYPRMLMELKQKREKDLQAVAEQNQKKTAELSQTYERDSRALRDQYEANKFQNQERYLKDWSALEKRWHEGMTASNAIIQNVQKQSTGLFARWNDSMWQSWQPPREFSPDVRFGQFHVDLQKAPGGLSSDPGLQLTIPTAFDVPALLSFPEPCSMLLLAGAQGRDEAVQTVQTTMFRLLTTLPPGKVRFTIIDPVGLGQNFAGFMHLADYEGAFVTDKIWTEDRHIEQRLADLTEHMENVIQKYLRNEYATIGDYNVDAGEIAEPFRFLVIANFPVNFSETAARRLASIVNSGARCGVYTLITVDTRQSLPPGIQLSDLERSCIKLTYDAEARRYVWNDPDFQQFPLTIDAPPEENFVTEKLHIIGKAAKESTRVEVPFDVVAPQDNALWSLNTTSDLHVALGRAGATKLQYLTLGVGTSQHALVAGKTGSGKSTLLHALITNLALWYPPYEVEFYLIDFKKGVEFKTYATHELPHARTVAIESDREFGLSVLQRLDAELKHRGNVYRDLGVQDLAAYRKTDFAKTHPVPRTLLIIDEFQELFTEDDKIGQDAALLLDRLVRQGRAFGMHVLLGSQTLGGAYSLARSTINQMAVRIALQCSEADSYLILSDDNAAARLLARPGEAIYNDASGMVEGNNPFQIVWLPDEKRERCLQRVQTIAKQRKYHPPEPQIVFEGNVPAEFPRNYMLRELLAQPEWGQKKVGATAAAYAWLGDAIAIKDPTSALFRRQSGNNLLIVGQREEAALAMMATSLYSIAAQHAPGQVKIYLLDGTPVDAPTSGYLARIAALLPHNVQVVSWRDVPNAMVEIGEELERRQQQHESESSPVFLLIYGLQRFRMLRQEDDFGLSSSSLDGDAPVRPERIFGSILRDGPVLGIHTLTWCDTVNNLNRSLDRQGLKEFEIRVLFQMGSTDSSNLIDSPVAARLGLHRALFYSEEQGQLEKFRPYALPEDQWLKETADALRRRETTADIKAK